MNKALEALFKIQKKLYEEGIFFSKQGKNLHFNSKYLQLPDLLSTVVPLLHSEDCMLLQGSRHSDNPDIAIIVTSIIHKDGDRYDNETDLPVAKLNPQEMGKAITYGRRYGLEPLFGIPTKDDDGEGATNREEPVKKPVKTPGSLPILKTLENETGLSQEDITSKLAKVGIDINNDDQIKAVGKPKILKILGV